MGAWQLDGDTAFKIKRSAPLFGFPVPVPVPICSFRMKDSEVCQASLIAIEPMVCKPSDRWMEDLNLTKHGI